MARHLYKIERARIIFGFILFILVAAATIIWSTTARTPNLPNPPLKELAANHGVQLGNFASLSRLNDKPYSNILTGQYGFVTMDGEPNWTFNDGALRPSPDTYDFRNLDKVMRYAQAHNMPVQAHHLVWGEEKWLPAWLKNGHYDKAQLLDIIHRHIQTVAGRYKGQIREWTVVNEAFSRASHIYGLHDWWADHIGDQSYIDQSFIWAHQADPKAKLILNDFNNETENNISNAMYNYVKGAKARGIPIDGVGFQMHLDGTDPPKKEDIIKNMQRFAKLGVGVYVTEFDVNMNSVQGTQLHRDRLESDIYYNVARACIESKVCHSFAELGITDKASWYNEMGLKNADPLPFDEKYRPKPAFYSFRLAWEQS
jgi:endo-1,4-beta-xylanase